MLVAYNQAKAAFAFAQQEAQVAAAQDKVDSAQAALIQAHGQATEVTTSNPLVGAAQSVARENLEQRREVWASLMRIRSLNDVEAFRQEYGVFYLRSIGINRLSMELWLNPVALDRSEIVDALSNYITASYAYESAIEVLASSIRAGGSAKEIMARSEAVLSKAHLSSEEYATAMEFIDQAKWNLTEKGVIEIVVSPSVFELITHVKTAWGYAHLNNITLINADAKHATRVQFVREGGQKAYDATIVVGPHEGLHHEWDAMVAQSNISRQVGSRLSEIYARSGGFMLGQLGLTGTVYENDGEVVDDTFIAEDGGGIDANWKTEMVRHVQSVLNDTEHYPGHRGLSDSERVVLEQIVEAMADSKGLIWPANISPFDVHLVSIGDVQERADELYQKLTDEGVEVLYDDRDVSVGEKLADSDLIGITKRMVISEKSLKAGGAEVKMRASDEVGIEKL